MPRKLQLSPIGLLLSLAAAGVALPAWGDGETPPAAQAITNLMLRAANGSLAARFERQSLEATRSRYALSTTVDPASLEFHAEGLDTALGREANAIEYLRLVKPTAAPWHSGARRQFRQSLADWHQQATDGTSLNVAAEVAQLWLDWAAAEAEKSLRASRLERIERALTLFKNRYRLGEVAGTDVRQLDAQRAGDRIVLTESQLRAQANHQQLFALLGFEPPAPDSESLGQLSRWLPDTGEPAATHTTVEAGRIAARAELASDLASLEEKTAGGVPSLAFELERVPSFEGMSSVEAFGLQVSLPLPFGRSVEKRRAAARAQGVLAQA